MINNSTKEADHHHFPLKQEGLSSSCDHNNEKAKANISTSSSSSQWLKLKDPRIVRVSRAFGGKDRHSKVCTIRGLRDRRVRLSVPTAIHLYDLQDRLGLNQPSKVVDWLLNAAKHEIDELPPLPIPPGNFTLGYPSLVCNEGSGQNSASLWKSSSKSGGEMVLSHHHHDKANWITRSEEGDDNNNNNNNNKDLDGALVLPNSSSNSSSSSTTLLPRPNHASFLGLMNTMPSLGYNWEPNNNSSGDVAAQWQNHHGFVNSQQTDVLHSINVVPFPSTLALSTGNTSSSTPQILVCPPPGATTQPYFPSHHVAAAMEMNARQINHYQMLSSSSHHQNLLENSLNPSQHQLLSQSGKLPFSLGIRPKLFHSPNTSESHSQQKEQDFPSK